VERLEQGALQVREGGAHTDQRRASAHRQRVAQEAVLSRDQELGGMVAHEAREPPEGSDRVERRHLDPDHVRQCEQRMQRRGVVRHAPRRLVQVEHDHRQLAAECLVVAHRIVGAREREQRVRAARLRLRRHRHARRSGDDHAQGQRGAPGLEHAPALLGR